MPRFVSEHLRQSALVVFTGARTAVTQHRALTREPARDETVQPGGCRAGSRPAAASALPALGLAALLATGLLCQSEAMAQPPPEPPAELPAEPPPAPPPDPADLWYPLDGPPALMNGYGNDSGGAYFNMSLWECQAPADAALNEPDVGPLPEISSFAELVRYAYELDDDALDWPAALRTPRIRVGSRGIFETYFRHAECRALLREALEEGYSLDARREGGRFVVANIVVPEIPLPLAERDIPPLRLSAEQLERFAGYYFGYPDTLAHEFSPIFRLLPGNGVLMLEWSGRRFELLPHSETSFGTQERHARIAEGEPHVAIRFGDSEAVPATVSTQSLHHNVPDMLASPIAAAAAESWLEAADRRIAAGQWLTGARELVAEIGARFETAAAAGESLAAAAARAIREQLLSVYPEALLQLGTLREIAFREALPAGRDMFDVRFERLTLEVTVVAGSDSTPAAVLIDALCSLNDPLTAGRQTPCAVPQTIGIERGAIAPNGTAPRALGFGIFSGFVGAGSDSEVNWAHRINLQRCEVPEQTPTADDSAVVGPRPAFATLRDVVSYAYSLEPYELVWTDRPDPPVAAGSDGYPLLRHDDCRTVLRQGLADEVGLEGHFEPGVATVWQLVVGADGARLDTPTVPLPQPVSGFGNAIVATHADMGQLADYLERRLRLPIIDATGLDGSYRWSLRWNPDALPAAGTESDLEGVRAGLSQIGLMLVAGEVPITGFVVDRIEPPDFPDARLRAGF